MTHGDARWEERIVEEYAGYGRLRSHSPGREDRVFRRLPRRTVKRFYERWCSSCGAWREVGVIPSLHRACPACSTAFPDGSFETVVGRYPTIEESKAFAETGAAVVGRSDP